MALQSTRSGRALLAMRTALGLSTLLAPSLAAKVFSLDREDNPQLLVIARMWGVRTLTLAAAMSCLTGASRRRRWRLQSAVDLLDFGVIVLEGRRGTVPGRARWLMATAALAAIALGLRSAAPEAALIGPACRPSQRQRRVLATGKIRTAMLAG